MSNEIWIALLSCGIGSTLLSGIFTLIQIRMDRKERAKDRAHEMSQKSFQELKKKIDASMRASEIIVRHIMKNAARNHIKEGTISYDERQDLMDLFKVYHDCLGGNGNIATLIEEAKKLPIK